jgi:hypothetical protein
MDRVATDRPLYSGKHRKHGMNLQVIASPDGDIVWVSGPLPGAVHDLTAARIRGIIAELAACGLLALGDKGCLGEEHIRTPYRGRNKPASQKDANRAYARLRAPGERGIYDAWTEVLRTAHPRFAFTDPPVRNSLPIALSFAATADRPTAVLTGPGVITGTRPRLIRLPRAMIGQDMVLAGLDHHPLIATAAVVWNGDLPRPLQQILFDAADGITSPTPVGTGEHEPATVSQ